MPIYNIVLNSLNKVAGGANNSCYYHFDWSVLPRGEYKVTFNYQGGPNTISFYYLCLLSVDLGQSKIFTSSSIRTIAPSTQVIGHLLSYNVKPVTTTNSSYLASSLNNTAVYLNSVPTNNQFLVQVISQWDGELYLDEFGNPNADYILILSLELIE